MSKYRKEGEGLFRILPATQEARWNALRGHVEAHLRAYNKKLLPYIITGLLAATGMTIGAEVLNQRDLERVRAVHNQQIEK